MLQNNKIIAVALMGNVVEYYGFSVFAVFTLQISKAFFPDFNPFLQIIFTQMLFGSGFITRPLGSLVFGHFGDRIGRKKVLNYTILGMALATCFIGFVPGYDDIGIAAPILVLILRLVQGFCVGGEGAGSALYALEHNKGHKDGRIGGIIISSIIFGSFLAHIIGIVANIFYDPDLLNWRIPFYIGGSMGLVGLYLRFKLPETQDFIKVQRENKIKKIPIKLVIIHYWRKMIVIALLGGVTAGVSYIIMAYLGSYFRSYLKLTEIECVSFALYIVSVFIMMLLVLGNLSDKFNYRNYIKFFNILLILFIFPIFKGINSDNILIFFLALTLLPVICAGLCAPAYPYVYQMFRPEIRYSAVAVSYNLGITFFGGFSPAISTALVKVTNLYYAPAFYIVLLSILYLFFEAVFNVKEYDEFE